MMSELKEISGMRHIWTADPGERIVSTDSYRGKLMIATDRRVLAYDGETDTIQTLEFVALHPENESDFVAAFHRSHP